MSKVDDMKARREEQWREAQERAKKAARASISPPDEPANNRTAEIVEVCREPEEAPPPAAKPRAVRAAEAIASAVKGRQPSNGEGRCVGCNKIRATRNGLIVAHQKGLGTPCPGSRKEPK